MHPRCVYRVLVHRHCVYRVLIVSPVHIQSVQCIGSAYTRCSVYGQFAYRVSNASQVRVLGDQCIAPALLRTLLYSFFNIGSRWDWWLTPRLGRFPPRNDSVPTVQDAGWDPGPFCNVYGKSRFHQDSSSGPSNP